MMILELTERQERLRARAASFAEHDLEPLAASIDERNVLPAELIRQSIATGLVNLGLDDEGDGGSDRIAAAVVVEALARGSGAVALHLGVTQLARGALRRFGAPAQIQQGGAGLSTGADTAAVIVADPGAHHEPGADGVVVRDLHASWVCNLQLASVVVCVSAPRDRSASAMAWVESMADCNVRRIERPDPIGLRGAGWGDATISRRQVDPTSMLGPGPASDTAARWVLGQARVLGAAVAVGIGRAALNHAVIVTRTRADRDSQAVRFALADASAELDAAWLLTLEAAQDEGGSDTGLASMAKFLASEAAVSAADTGLRLGAPDSYQRGSTAERLSRDARAIGVPFGTSDRARLDAARALGLTEG